MKKHNHKWSKTGRMHNDETIEVCSSCNAICIREVDDGDIWYYSAPTDPDIGPWEGMIVEVERR